MFKGGFFDIFEDNGIVNIVFRDSVLLDETVACILIEYVETQYSYIDNLLLLVEHGDRNEISFDAQKILLSSRRPKKLALVFSSRSASLLEDYILLIKNALKCTYSIRAFPSRNLACEWLLSENG